MPREPSPLPLTYARRVAEAANASLTIVENGGHLNAETGYTQFPLLLTHIGHQCQTSGK